VTWDDVDRDRSFADEWDVVQRYENLHDLFVGPDGSGLQEANGANGLGIREMRTVDWNKQMDSRTTNWKHGEKPNQHLIKKQQLLQSTVEWIRCPNGLPPLPMSAVSANVSDESMAAVQELRRKYIEELKSVAPFVIPRATVVLHCYTEEIRRFAEAYKANASRAVRGYIHKRRNVMASLPNFGNPDEIVGQSADHQPSIFGAKCTSEVYQFKENRSQNQKAWADHGGYVAFPAHHDAVGAYHLYLAGKDVDILVKIPDGTSVVNRKRLWTFADVSDDVEITFEPREPWSSSKAALLTHVCEFANFIKRFDSTPDESLRAEFPWLLPLGKVVPGTGGQIWEDVVHAHTSKKKPNRATAEWLFHFLFENIRLRNEVPRAALAKGIPGVGKTTVFEHCAEAMGLEHHMSRVLMEKVLGDGLQGDRVACTVSTLYRYHGCCGVCAHFLDEADYVLNDAEENKENVAPVVGRLDGSGEQNSGHFFYVAVNDWTQLPEKLISRFGHNITFVGVQRVSETRASYESYPETHPMTAGTTCDVAAVMALGLAARDSMDVHAGATLSTFQKMRNELPTDGSGGTNIAQLAVLPAAGPSAQARRLAEELVQHSRCDVATGRIVVFQHPRCCIVDMEVTDGRTIAVVVRSMEDVYWALLQLCKDIDAYSMQYLQNVTKEGSEKAKVLKMQLELYLTSYTAAVLIVPVALATILPTTGGGSVSKAVDANLQAIITGDMFKKSPSGKKQFVVLHVASTEEFKVASCESAQPFFTASQVSKEAAAAAEYEEGKKVECRRCGTLFAKGTIEAMKQCLHEPRTGHATLMTRVKYRDNACLVDKVQRLEYTRAVENIKSGQYNVVKEIEIHCGYGCRCTRETVTHHCVGTQQVWRDHTYQRLGWRSFARCVRCLAFNHPHLGFRRWGRRPVAVPGQCYMESHTLPHDGKDCTVHYQSRESCVKESDPMPLDTARTTYRKDYLEGELGHVECLHNCSAKVEELRCANAPHQPPSFNPTSHLR
jgi:hypothetical protein